MGVLYYTKKEILNTSISKLSDGLYLSIFFKLFENLKEPQLFRAELIELLTPTLDLKIKELEEEIKAK